MRVDEPTGAGGTDTGPSPTRLVAAGLASCIAVTVEMYAERKGWDAGQVEVDVDVEYEGFAPSPSRSPCACRPSSATSSATGYLRSRASARSTSCSTGEAAVAVSDQVEPL